MSLTHAATIAPHRLTHPSDRRATAVLAAIAALPDARVFDHPALTALNDPLLRLRFVWALSGLAFFAVAGARSRQAGAVVFGCHVSPVSRHYDAWAYVAASSLTADSGPEGSGATWDVAFAAISLARARRALATGDACHASSSQRTPNSITTQGEHS